MASWSEGNLLELLKGRYCLFCILDVIKDSASALWKAVVIGSKMMGLKTLGLDINHNETNLVVGRSGYPYESPIFAGNSSSSGSPVLKFTLGWNTLVSKLTWRIPKRETAEDGTTTGPSKKESDLEKMWGYRSCLPTHHVRINTKARTTGPLRRRFFAQQVITHFKKVSTKNWHLKTFKIALWQSNMAIENGGYSNSFQPNDFNKWPPDTPTHCLWRSVGIAGWTEDLQLKATSLIGRLLTRENHGKAHLGSRRGASSWDQY